MVELNKSLPQDAVLYAFSGYTVDGLSKVSAGVAIKCRWEQDVVELLTPDDGAYNKTVTVFVDREISIDSVLWKGKLADVPSPLSNLFQVIHYTEIPDIKGRHPTRTVRLRRLAKVPTIV